ncbi:mandelate racemase/muconate lactonizing enzyme family protein [Micromonospora sp. DR5-3]|uniref:mandelate racemase/muconate lactonizing enzyme family protein n=1 Tax=unclassified Micromonospora TaxID=2617518 RepID=UPI0011D5143D|nr:MULTISPECIES: mandelate racemase/muconate lactonizing enzyme family protein [unclassified Micromonospora]MCW3818895.1 mandelate racemase/muconate lactonizing enzyme family protein [Micromonospora sp. DR5-3]TYC18194.1 mandelate racemase/muconate lactonizing enzyme family protein [Micromonospora sp. MP36]
MRIVDVTTALLTGPSTGDPWLLPFKKLRSAAFIEVRTSSGDVGVGETYAGYFFPESVPLVVDYLKPILLNAESFDDPTDLDIETLCRRMRLCCAYWGRVGLGAAVIAGIEAALWDLKGKLLGAPVCELLGGARHARLPAYATGGPSPWPMTDLLRKADHYLGLGFRAFKVSSGYVDMESREEMPSGDGPNDAAELEVEKVSKLREHVGRDVGILLDGHMGHRESAQRWNVSTAMAVLQALEPYEVLLFEEPLPYHDLTGYAELCERSTTRVAGGEQLSRLEEFKLFADHRAFSVAQPDAAWLGLSELGEVAALFGQIGRSIAPHAWGAGGAVMQNVHAAFAAPNTLIVELPPDAGPLHREIWGDSLRLADGYLTPPTAPGLGINLSQKIKEAYPFVPGAEEFSSVPGKLMRS